MLCKRFTLRVNCEGVVFLIYSDMERFTMNTKSLSVIMLTLSIALTCYAKDFYVSPAGSDTHPGTAEKPFQTLQRAQQAVRAVNASMNENITVHIAAGDYILDEPVTFTDQDSGSNGCKVVYRSSGGPGQARLLGGRRLTGWEKVDSKVWKIHLPENQTCHTLYENGTRIRKARQPNYIFDPEFPTAAGPYFASEGGSTEEEASDTESWLFSSEKDFMGIPADFGTMKINVFPWGKCDWHRWICSVTGIDTETRKIIFANEGDKTKIGDKRKGREKARYFLEEHRDFLDAPGEFYFDPFSRILYLIPQSAKHPDQLNIVLPVLFDLIRFEGSSITRLVHDIEIEGLALEYSKAISPTRFWWAQKWGYTDHALIWMNYTTRITVRNCHLKNSGRSGIMMVGQNTQNLVYGCWIEQTGVNGITLSNWAPIPLPKNFDSFRLEHNILSNNKIHDIGQLSIYCACINMYSVNCNEISYSEFFRSPRYATTLRGHLMPDGFVGPELAPKLVPSYNNTFKFLRIYDCSQDSGDCAAIHSAMVNPENGPYINTYQQITIDNTRAAAHMKDIPPDGIFLDWPGQTMHQRFVDMQITNAANKQFRSNGKRNEESANTENVNWKPGFDKARMQYDQIGLKADFPKAYGLQAKAHRVWQVAKKQPRPAQLPKYSDVIMRSLYPHPAKLTAPSERCPNPDDAQDPWDTIQAVKDFHVSRLEWVYDARKEYVDKAKAEIPGLHFGLTLNSILVDKPFGPTVRKVGRAVDLEGNRIAAPWMSMWTPPGYWGCANSEDYREVFMKHARACIDAGADSLQVDDPAMNRGTVKWGGCYCDSCMKKFLPYLSRNASKSELESIGIKNIADFDYKKYLLENDKKEPQWLREYFVRFQNEAVGAYFKDLRNRVTAYAGRHIPMSFNEYVGNTELNYAQYFDYGFRELHVSDSRPERIHEKLQMAFDVGKRQIMTIPKAFKKGYAVDVQLARQVIATAYSMGGNIMVPWDTYLRSTPEGSERYFGKPEEYADLYGFVRNNAKWFDGYEEAALAGGTFKETRYGKATPLEIAEDLDVYGVVRAVPGDPSAPVVVHLVDWSKEPKAFRVTLNPEMFFGNKPLKVSMLMADGSKKLLAGGSVSEVDVPKLSPWGVLIVEADGK